MENQSTIQPTEIPIPQVVQKKNNLPLIFGGVLVLLLVIAGSVYLGMKIQEKKVEKAQIPSPDSIVDYSSPTSSPTVISEPTLRIDETANWKTYTNTALGFELKYPPEVSIAKEFNDQNNKATFFKGGDLNFEVMLRDGQGITLDKYYYMDSSVKRKTTLAGYSANVYELPLGYGDGPNETGTPSITVVALKGDYLYHLIFNGDIKLDDTENRIISTFKFIDTTSPSKTGGANLKDIKYVLPKNWKAQLTSDNLTLSNINGGALSVRVYQYSSAIGRREYYCQVSKYCIDGTTYFDEFKIGNISGYKASALDNSGGGSEYFGSKGDKFYIVSSYSPSSPNPNDFDTSYKSVLDSLIF